MSWSNERKSMISSGMEFWIRCRTTNIMLGTQPSNPDIYAEYIATRSPDPASTMEEELLANATAAEGIDDDEMKKTPPTIFPVARFFKPANGTRLLDPQYDIIPEDLEGEFVVLPFMYDYQMRGSFKESIAMLAKASGGRAAKNDDSVAKYACANITSYKKVVDGNWFVTNRKIPLMIPETYIDEMGREIPTFNEKGQLPQIVRPLRADTAKGPRTALAASEYVPAGTEFFLGIRLLNIKDLKACLETLDYKASVGMLQWRGGGKGTLIWTLCNKEGVPYDELDESQLTAQDKTIMERVNKILDGFEPVDEVAEEKPKRGRKKKVEAESEDQVTMELEEKPKKRGRKKKEEAAAE